MTGAVVPAVIVFVAMFTSFLTLTFRDPLSSLLWHYTGSGLMKPGCAPIPSIGKVKLHYFASRGRAEPIRMLLTLGKIPYEEVNFDEETWPEQKKRGIAENLYLFGQVPAIETNTGVKLVQSMTIAHYIGRSIGMDCDCHQLHICELVAQASEDMRQMYYKTIYNPNFSLADREEYFLEKLPVWLGYLENIIPCGVSPHMAGNRTTWSDIMLYDVLDENIAFLNMNLGPGMTVIDLFGKYPNVNKFFRAITLLPGMRTYRKKQFKLKLPYMPKELEAGDKS